MKPAQYVKNWCDSKESFSFFLPDGPEGRPFDTSYQVIDTSEDGKGFAIRLSDGIQFIFEGNVLFRDENSNLIIIGFSRLIYKVNGVVMREFTDGEFCLSGF